MRGWEIAAAGGGLLIVGMGAWWLYSVKSAATGDPGIDDGLPRAAFELARVGLFAPKYLRALASCWHNEHSDGRPSSNVHDVLDVGDVDAHGGPSGGRGQAYRSTCLELGLWPRKEGMTFEQQLDDQDDRDAFAAFCADPSNDGELIRWSVVIFKSKLAIANGDLPKTVELYNGSGPGAEKYLANAQAFHQLRYGQAIS